MSRAGFHLDTSAVVSILRDRPAVVRERLRRAQDEGHVVAVSGVAMFELWYGVARGTHSDKNTQRLRQFLDGGIEIVAFDHEDAQIAGTLRAQLERAGTPIGPYDVLIAAQALRTGATLVTANVGEFARVPDLTWENWSLPA